MHLSASQVKALIEGEGHDFKAFKEELSQKIRMDIIDRKGIYNEIINEALQKQAQTILMDKIPTKKNEKAKEELQNSNTIMESKGENK